MQGINGYNVIFNIYTITHIWLLKWKKVITLFVTTFFINYSTELII